MSPCFAWHNDDPDYDVLLALGSLKPGFVQSLGYVNLRGVWGLGWPIEIRPYIDAATNVVDGTAANPD